MPASWCTGRPLGSADFIDGLEALTIRYVELNPVRAKLVRRAEKWRWSSARAHITGRPDGFTDLAAMRDVHRNVLIPGNKDQMHMVGHQCGPRPWESSQTVARFQPAAWFRALPIT